MQFRTRGVVRVEGRRVEPGGSKEEVRGGGQRREERITVQVQVTLPPRSKSGFTKIVVEIRVQPIVVKSSLK